MALVSISWMKEFEYLSRTPIKILITSSFETWNLSRSPKGFNLTSIECQKYGTSQYSGRIWFLSLGFFPPPPPPPYPPPPPCLYSF